MKTLEQRQKEWDSEHTGMNAELNMHRYKYGRPARPSEKLDDFYEQAIQPTNGFLKSISMKEQEGPIAGMRPATFYKSCSGCKYLNHNLVKSGHDPIYRDDCTHEAAPKPAMKLSFTGNLEKVGDKIEPGDWCPFEPVNLNPNF